MEKIYIHIDFFFVLFLILYFWDFFFLLDLYIDRNIKNNNFFAVLHKLIFGGNFFLNCINIIELIE